jgi:hypothetical protein
MLAWAKAPVLWESPGGVGLDQVQRTTQAIVRGADQAEAVVAGREEVRHGSGRIRPGEELMARPRNDIVVTEVVVGVVGGHLQA